MKIQIILTKTKFKYLEDMGTYCSIYLINEDNIPQRCTLYYDYSVSIFFEYTIIWYHGKTEQKDTKYY